MEGPGRLRPLTPYDLPEIAALRQRVFRFSERGSLQAVAAYCERVFCHHPWPDDDLWSLVYEDERGRVAGFLGVIPRRMLFRGEPIRAAIATQIMVAPEARGLAGRRLLRAFLSGPQDLSLSDTANDPARRLWESLGGRVATVHSLIWERPLRPFRHFTARLAQNPVLRAALLPARPLFAASDALAAWLPRPFRRGSPHGRTEPLNAQTAGEAAEQILSHHALRPAYDAETFAWLLGQAAEKHQFGSLTGALVRQASGELAGWFVHYVERGGTSEVVQVAARRKATPLVLAHLLQDARRRGASAVAGRLEPGLLQELAGQGCALRRDGPWTLFHARRPEIVQAIDCGDAFLSRLDGEWWLSF
ncbi:MAG: GNAT family N-acetyltransferase [Gemmatimonadetes bacterium]|nr:GNAT family N-acetyltransferase [Gemmatimonadota bacterium]